jgi:dihydropteroate synthase
MDSLARYDEIAAEVVGEWIDARDAAAAAGLPSSDVWFDPGIGFAKSVEHNWQLLRAFSARRPVDVPIVYGISRKRFVAFGEADARRRDAASVALATLLAAAGADVLRMHDVAGARRAVDVAMAMAVAA